MILLRLQRDIYDVEDSIQQEISPLQLSGASSFDKVEQLELGRVKALT